MDKSRLLVDKEYLLEKFSGKGGWTFARIPEILQDKSKPFGWVKVKGSIDGFEIMKYHLMPLGNGQLFLPVRAEIRKKIKKQAGDTVKVILYADEEPTELPEELRLCLEDDPKALLFFTNLPSKEQERYIGWIYAAKHEDLKVARIVKALDWLRQGILLPQTPPKI
jgi:Domain of unknown function (DUF1905)/Bacteriocin-protection, YdeI or OmpD-Associated